ncbi:MAG TPA: glucose-1-phosphate cytidylyltransferase [Burkholderiales bacterium]|nr:glucose-1-phosphate cytidylyltransferase [Burkholderiales bacterium]
MTTKAVILAGGLGTRLGEETESAPKPMVQIGAQPILWHIMKIYSAHGINDFIVCLGYKGYAIKEYFANYFLHMADVTFDVANNRTEILSKRAEAWRVTLVDTGADTMTGGRLKRVAGHIGGDTFCMTYGDGLANVDVRASIDFHRRHGRAATVTAVRPSARFGALDLEGDRVAGFREKPLADGSWINGGFFVLEPRVLDLIDNDGVSWEREPMERLAANNDLHAYKHKGFWQPMDTLREKKQLVSLWESGQAPWKIW